MTKAELIVANQILRDEVRLLTQDNAGLGESIAELYSMQKNWSLSAEDNRPSRMLTERKLCKMVRKINCGPHQECDDKHPCSCRDIAATVLVAIKQMQSGGRIKC